MNVDFAALAYRNTHFVQNNMVRPFMRRGLKSACIFNTADEIWTERYVNIVYELALSIDELQTIFGGMEGFLAE